MPYFERDHPDIAEYYGTNCRRLFNLIFPGPYAPEISFLGSARPAFGAIPPMSEMQARYLAMVLNREVSLPSVEEMEKKAAALEKRWDTRFWDDQRIKSEYVIVSCR